jgi:hydrogenase maturation factor
LLASDFTTSANQPQFAVFDFNLPRELDENDLTNYVRALGKECKRLGISIVGGHTGKYPGSAFTVVGGGVLFGIAAKSACLTPRDVREGDSIILTKGAAIEATAILSHSRETEILKTLGSRVLASAKHYLYKASTVKDATIAVSVGIKADGVTSMHDATEGGVLGGLNELAIASRKNLSVDPGRIHVSTETRSICTLFGIDPLTTLSEGSLIITCRPDKTEEIRKKLRRNHISNFEIGSVEESTGGSLKLTGKTGRTSKFVPADADPYWAVYEHSPRPD